MKLNIKKTTIHITILLVLFLLFARIFFIPWIIGDGLHYYAPLRSLVIDNDLDFTNEYTYMRTLNRGGVIDPDIKTVTGLVPNQWAVGNAIFWSPFFLAAHILEIINGKEADGYSQTYYNFVTFGTLVFSFLTLILIYSFLKKFVNRNIALATTIGIFICSTMFYYTYHDPSMSHIFSVFTVTSFIYYWYITHKNRTLSQHINLGFLAGLMLLTRWQNGLFLVLILYEIPSIIINRNFKNLTLNITNKICFLITTLITFLPQMIFWKIIYGSYLTMPIGEFKFYGYPRYLAHLFFSPTHGLFTWTPMIFFSFVGFYYLLKENKELFSYLMIPLALQVLFISSTSVWHGSWSYGIRMLTNCTLIFAMGLAYLIKELNKKFPLGIIYFFLLPFVLWNLLLMTQVHYYHPLIDPDYPFSKILVNQIKVAPNLLVKLILHKFT